MNRARMDKDIKNALDNLDSNPYVHSRDFGEFCYLEEVLGELGFRCVGNVDVCSDPFNCDVWNRVDYEVIRTLGYTHNGEPLQDFEGKPGNDYICFFVRQKELREAA
jgi:hypothetical protein